MSTLTALTKAREEMLQTLDAKLAKMPEWRAFRSIDSAITALSEMARLPSDANANRPPVRRRGRTPGLPTYADLAVEALEANKAPMPTNDVVTFVASKRHLDPKDDKVRVNIQSGMSRDRRIKNIPWLGGRAWWMAEHGIPEKNAAGT